MHLRIVEIYFSLLIYWSGCKLSDDQNICDIKLSCSGVEYIMLETETAYLALIILTRSSKLNWQFFMLTNSQKNVFWAKLKQELWMLPSRPSSSKGYYECCSKSSEIQRMDRWWWKILKEHLGNLCTALHSVLDDDYDYDDMVGGSRWWDRLLGGKIDHAKYIFSATIYEAFP